MNKKGCGDCQFFIKAKEVCTAPSQPKGTDGYLHLHNWRVPNECKLHKSNIGGRNAR